MNTILLLSPEDQANINRCIQYADDNPVHFDRLLKMVHKTEPPVGDDPNHVVNLFKGYRVVYSLEHHGKQPKQDGLVMFRHISISTKDGKPGLHATQLILDSYQFDLVVRDLEKNSDVTVYEEGPNIISIIALDKRPQPSSSPSST